MSYQSISDALKNNSASSGGGSSNGTWMTRHQIIQSTDYDPTYEEAMSKFGTTVSSAFKNSMSAHINENYHESDAFPAEGTSTGGGSNSMNSQDMWISWTGNGGKINK